MDSICVDAVDRCTGNDHLPASPQVPSPHNDVSHTIILWLENDGAEVPYWPITRFDLGCCGGGRLRLAESARASLTS